MLYELRGKEISKKNLPDRPLISIITVVLNGESYLERTISSVLNQTYKNFEYIIVDGGSTDNTIAIIQKYEKLINYWISEPDDGIYDAMNKGVDLANGKWINFMNCGDEFYNNNVFSDIFKNEYPENVRVICGDTELINGNKRFIKEVRFVNKNNPMPFCHQSVFVQNKIMKKYKFNTQYKIMADRLFFYILFYNEKILAYQVNTTISKVQLYGYSNESIVKARKELNLILKKYGLISNIMAALYLIYAYMKDCFNYIIYKFKKFKLTNLLKSN